LPLLTPPTPRPPLFPYTTLFRSQTRYAFRLHEFPLAAALRIEPEPEYCKRRFEEYGVARMIERATPPDSRTLALVTVANAYLARDRKSTRLNSSHLGISYAVFCL